MVLVALGLGSPLVLAAARPAAQEPALEQLAAQVSGALAGKGFAPPMGVYVEGAPAPLQRAFASVLAARLSTQRLAPVVLDARDATEAERLARDNGVASLVRLTLSLAETRLTVRGDALSTWVNFWSGSVPTRSGPALAVTGAAEADAQALALADRPPLAPGTEPLSLTAAALARLPQVPAAVAVADVTGDQQAEVLVLSGEHLHALDVTGRAVWKTALSAPAAARPCREPFGAIAVGNGKVIAWSARRERPEAFSLQGRALGPVDALTVEGLALKADPGFNRFQPTVTWAGKALTFPAPPQAVSVFGPLALVVFPDGTAALPRGVAPTTRLAGVGSGSALADFDNDGTPELVVTSARTGGAVDEARVVALAEAEALTARAGVTAEATALWQQPLAGRALVAAAGDLDGDGADEVVLGTWLPDGSGELIVLRRARP